jgi:GTP pyrophosphokinase
MKLNYDKQVMQKAHEVFHVMSKRVSEKDMSRIREAFDFANMAHADQKRKSGEPYIIHPVEVASIVAVELELGANPVIAAFLHDVVEDTAYTIDDIQKRFGKDVAFLVSVLTKQSKEHYEMSKQVDNYKQMLDSIHYDIRALLIKLADRLHNMRTLGSMPAHKQMKIAGETDFFYAPLANRLGLYPIKIELENLSFRYRCPHDYEEIARMLHQDELCHEGRLHNFTDKIRMVLGKEFGDVFVHASFRAPYSIWRKMQKTGDDFSHIPFRHIVEIIFPCEDVSQEKDVALRIYSRLTSVFNEKPCSVISYIDSAKENGYQSYHVQLLSEFGSWEEVHISSERMVRNNQIGVVAERREDSVRMWIDKFRKVLRDLDFHQEEGGYMDNVVTALYNDNIMVFTPKGESVNLPKKITASATALDFAFEIHSKIGEHAHYARINGQLSSIMTELQRGDIVEIVTSPTIEPQEDWANHVLTYKAKNSLKRYFAKKEKPKFHFCSECHPIPGEEVIGFKESDGSITVHKRNCHVVIGLASQQGDSIVPVDYEENSSAIYPVCIQILAVDRFHLLSDMINCITNELHLSINSLNTSTSDCIVRCTIQFGVHSFGELQTIIEHVSTIEGVEEVKRISE